MKKTLFFLFVLFLSGCTKPISHNPVNTEPSDKKQKLETVHIVEFFDYGCEHCRTSHNVFKKLQQTFGDKLVITPKHFPLKSETFLVAEASECARKQGAFESFSDQAFENFGVFTTKKMEEIAKKLNLNMENFSLCLKSGFAKNSVQQHINEGEVLGIKGTPFFLVNEKLEIPISLPEKSFETIIQKLLDGIDVG